MGKEPLPATLIPLCPRRQSQVIAAWLQKAAKRDFERKCISGEDGLMGASDELNIYLMVPPDGGDAGVPLPK